MQNSVSKKLQIRAGGIVRPDLTVPLSELIIFLMNKKSFLFLSILFAGISGLFAAELSGTYNKDYTVKTEFNTISKGKTLRITNGSTYVMRDAIVTGSIIVEKGSSMISPDDYEGYLVFGPGSHVEGIDLYYKVRVSENLVFTRKLPMTLDQVWKSGNQKLIDWVGIIEFCYSPALKGWVSINEVKYQNPFNENLYDEYDMVFTESVSRMIENECRSLTVKNKSTVVIQPNPGCWGTKVYEALTVEEGSALLGTDANGHKLILKKGVKVEGLPLYVRLQNDLIPTATILSELWKLPVFEGNEYHIIVYKPELKGWYFEDIILGDDNVPKQLMKKLKALK